MKRADVALTVGGILASMVLAYLLYRAQQRDQAATAAAATDQAAQDASANTAADPYNTQLAEEWLQASQLNNPAASATAATTPTTASSTSSGVDLGGPLVDTSSNDALLANIVAAYSSPPSSGLDLGGPLNLSSITPEQLAAMTIPAISGTVQQATGNIPTTAQDAAAQAMLAIAPNLYNYAMDSNSGVSSHPVDPIPTGPYSPGQNPVYIPGTNTLDPIQPLTLTAHPITQAGA